MKVQPPYQKPKQNKQETKNKQTNKQTNKKKQQNKQINKKKKHIKKHKNTHTHKIEEDIPIARSMATGKSAGSLIQDEEYVKNQHLSAKQLEF